MKKKVKKNLLSVFGVLALVLGISGSIPSFFSQSYFGLGTSLVFIVIGGILLAFAFSE